MEPTSRVVAAVRHPDFGVLAFTDAGNVYTMVQAPAGSPLPYEWEAFVPPVPTTLAASEPAWLKHRADPSYPLRMSAENVATLKRTDAVTVWDREAGAVVHAHVLRQNEQPREVVLSFDAPLAGVRSFTMDGESTEIMPTHVAGTNVPRYFICVLDA